MQAPELTRPPARSEDAPAIRSFVRRRLSSLSGRSIAAVVVTATFTLVPVGILVLNSFNVSGPGQAASYGVGNWQDAFSRSATWSAVWNTIALGATRMVLSLLVGVALAWIIARTDIRGSGTIEFLLYVTFFVPVLPLTLGWMLLIDPDFGLLNTALRSLPLLRSLETGPFNVFSFEGIVWVQLTAMTAPFVAVVLAPTLRRTGRQFEHAARICGAGRVRTFLRISVPLMLPAVLAALMISFVQSLKAFEVELILGGPIGLDVFSTQIFKWIRDMPPAWGVATAMGSGFIGLMVVLALAYRYAVTGRDFTTISPEGAGSDLIELGRRGRILAGLFCWGYIAVALVLPTIAIALGSIMRRFGFFELADPFTWQHWSAILGRSDFVSSIYNTFVLAGSTLLLGVLIYWAVAHFIVVSKSRGRALMDLLAWLPIAFPGILLGLGLLWLFLGTPLRSILFGTMFGLTIAIVIGHMATGVQQMKAGLLQMDWSLSQAAHVCGAGRIRTNWRITVPLLMPTFVAVGLLTLASAVRDISTVILLASRSTEPLSLLLLEYSSNGLLEEASILGLLIAAFCGVTALAVKRFDRGY